MCNKIQLLFLLVVCCMAFITAAQEEGGACGDNEEFKSCGSTCPPKCSDGDEPMMCSQRCVPECQCKSGYLLNSAGQCVEPENC